MTTDMEHGFSPAGSQYVSKTEKEILELAKAWYRNEVFFSFFLREHDRSLITSIFMPLAFLDSVQLKEMQRDEIEHFYGYMTEAAPFGVNGYPTFFSMGMLNRTDALRVVDKHMEILEMMGELDGKSAN